MSGLSLTLVLAAVVFSRGSLDAAVTPVSLYTENVATSVWDTDPTKVGVEFQIGNDGASAADNVLVMSVVVQGGALGGPAPLPIALGTIDPQKSALLDLVITVPRTDGTARYLVTISGNYVSSAVSHHFSLNALVIPNAAPPGPFIGQKGVVTKGSDERSDPNPPATAPPPSGPNATTPMMIPVGPPRHLLLPGPNGQDPATK